MGQVNRLSRHDFGVRHVVFRVRSRPAEDPRRVIDLIPHAELRHVGSDLVDNPGDVVPDDGRQFDLVGVVTAADLTVERVDRRRMHSHADLPWPRPWVA